MANSIKISGSLQWTDGNDSVKLSVSQTTTQVGDGAIWNVQNVGTAAEAIDLGDVSAIGYIAFENEDETNYVEISNESDVSTPTIRLLPGEGVVIPTRLTAWYAKANTAAVNLRVLAVEL